MVSYHIASLGVIVFFWDPLPAGQRLKIGEFIPGREAGLNLRSRRKKARGGRGVGVVQDHFVNVHGCQMFSLLREKMVGEFLHRRSQKDSITRLNHPRLKSIVPTELKKRSLMSITNHWERRFFGAIERGEPPFELYRVGK